MLFRHPPIFLRIWIAHLIPYISITKLGYLSFRFFEWPFFAHFLSDPKFPESPNSRQLFSEVDSETLKYFSAIRFRRFPYKKCPSFIKVRYPTQKRHPKACTKKSTKKLRKRPLDQEHEFSLCFSSLYMKRSLKKTKKQEILITWWW